MKKRSVIFCGIDEKVFNLIIKNHDFHLQAVSYFDDLDSLQSRNPTELVLVTLYKCIQKKSWIKATLLHLVLTLLKPFASKLTKKYFSYITALLKSKITLLDFSDANTVERYIHSHAIDLIIVSNWWKLPDNIIYAPTFGTINIHPSKLPQYRGSVPTLWSLKNKDTETAISFMRLNSKIDGGDVFAQHIIPISANEDSISLENKCDAAIAEFFLSDLKKYLAGELSAIGQDETQASNTAAYFPYMKIEWQKETSEEIVNKIKLYPHLWPTDFCYTQLENYRIAFQNAHLCQKIPRNIHFFQQATPGSFIRHHHQIYIKTINGFIKCRLFFDFSFLESIKFLMIFKNKEIFAYTT